MGQCELMYTYDKAFAEYNHTVAQILLTAPMWITRTLSKLSQHTLRRLLDLKACPSSTKTTGGHEEMGIGDNDTLAAVVP